MSKKSLHVHWRGEEVKSESNDGKPSAQNGILKNSTINSKNEAENPTPLRHVLSKKRVQNFIDPLDPKRQRQDVQNVNLVRQKQRAPLPPNVGSQTYNSAPISASSNRKMVSAMAPQQYVYLQQPGGSTRRYPPGYRSSRPQSAHNHVRSSRTLPPYRIMPPQFELLRMDDNSPQVRLGRYRPKVIQETFSPNTIRDADFLNKRREKTAPDKRKPEQTHTWEKQDSPEAKVTVRDANTPTLRTKTIVRLKASPIQPQNAQWRPKTAHVSSVTIPPKSSSTDTRDGNSGNYLIVDYLVDNLGPQMLHMKLTENGTSNVQTNGTTDGLLQVSNGPASLPTPPSGNSHDTTLTPAGSDSGVEMIEVQKQILQQRQSEVSLAQLPVSCNTLVPW